MRDFIVFFVLFFTLVAIPVLIMYTTTSVSYWLLFKKAGEPVWHAFIPFLNVYTHLKITGRNGTLILSIAIGSCVLAVNFPPLILVTIFISALMLYEIALVFGGDTKIAIANMVFFPIVMLYLGFSSQRFYIGPYACSDQRFMLYSPWTFNHRERGDNSKTNA